MCVCVRLCVCVREREGEREGEREARGRGGGGGGGEMGGPIHAGVYMCECGCQDGKIRKIAKWEKSQNGENAFTEKQETCKMGNLLNGKLPIGKIKTLPKGKFGKLPK